MGLLDAYARAKEQGDAVRAFKSLPEPQRREAQAREKEAQAREEKRKAFAGSPAGQARSAFDRGDRVFQFYMDVKQTGSVVVAMVGATTMTATADPTQILNSVCNEGWDLVNGSFVFHELGSESRDKFLASGQNVAVRGTIIGYYLFRRCEENRVTSDAFRDSPPRTRKTPTVGTSAATPRTPPPHIRSFKEPAD